MGLLTQGPGVFFLFVALVLLILVSCSVPVANWLYFLRADFAGLDLKLGNWGYCVGATCSSSRLGYNAQDVINNVANTGDVSGFLLRNVTYALILHPIAAAVVLIAIIVSLTNNVILDIIGSLISFFAFLVCLVALIIDTVLFVTARHRINDAFSGSPASLSAAYWMVVGATIATLIAAFTVCFGSRRARRQKHARESYASQPQPVMMEPSSRRRFWQRS